MAINNDVISRSEEQYPIDGEELFNRVQRLKHYEVRRKLFDEAGIYEVFKCQDVLDAILASERLDVAPVVHAMWIEDGYRGIPCVCSHCGEEAHYKSTFVEQYGYDWNENLVLCGYSESKEYIRSKCCPKCGARMDGDESV